MTPKGGNFVSVDHMNNPNPSTVSNGLVSEVFRLFRDNCYHSNCLGYYDTITYTIICYKSLNTAIINGTISSKLKLSHKIDQNLFSLPCDHQHITLSIYSF